MWGGGGGGVGGVLVVVWGVLVMVWGGAGGGVCGVTVCGVVAVCTCTLTRCRLLGQRMCCTLYKLGSSSQNQCAEHLFLFLQLVH